MKIRATYSYFGHVHKELLAIAERVSAGTWTAEPGESKEHACERIAAEVGAEFERLAGEATGAEAFCFEVAVSNQTATV